MKPDATIKAIIRHELARQRLTIDKVKKLTYSGFPKYMAGKGSITYSWLCVVESVLGINFDNYDIKEIEE